MTIPNSILQRDELELELVLKKMKQEYDLQGRDYK